MFNRSVTLNIYIHLTFSNQLFCIELKEMLTLLMLNFKIQQCNNCYAGHINNEYLFADKNADPIRDTCK